MIKHVTLESVLVIPTPYVPQMHVLEVLYVEQRFYFENATEPGVIGNSVPISIHTPYTITFSVNMYIMGSQFGDSVLVSGTYIHYTSRTETNKQKSTGTTLTPGTM